MRKCQRRFEIAQKRRRNCTLRLRRALEAIAQRPLGHPELPRHLPHGHTGTREEDVTAAATGFVPERLREVGLAPAGPWIRTFSWRSMKRSVARSMICWR